MANNEKPDVPNEISTDIPRALHETKLMLEQIREDIKKLGEGVAGVTSEVRQQLEDLDQRWAEKWSPHDLAIKDHGKRITVLERRRAR